MLYIESDPISYIESDPISLHPTIAVPVQHALFNPSVKIYPIIDLAMLVTIG